MQDVALFKISDVVMVNRKSFSTQTVNKSCYVLSCRLSGESEFSQNGKHFTAKRGDILYIPYGSSYYQRSNQEKVIYINLDHELYAENNNSKRIILVCVKNAD